jgi:hypothetical protein
MLYRDFFANFVISACIMNSRKDKTFLPIIECKQPLSWSVATLNCPFNLIIIISIFHNSHNKLFNIMARLLNKIKKAI